MITDNYTVGWEIEMDKYSIYEHKDKLVELFGKFGDVKPDGSVAQGFEVSSKINVFKDFHSNSLNPLWEEFYKKLDTIPAESNENCGQHIHIGRANLTDEDIAKINYFVFSSQSFMDAIGGRSANRWCYFRRNTLDNVKQKTGQKYCYVNVGHPNTIEFRFFRSPKTLYGFLRNVQFILAIVTFCKMSKNSEKYFRNKGQENMEKFLEFVKEHKQTYGFLASALDMLNEKFVKGEIAAEKTLNCDLYPTQKMKKALAGRIIRNFGDGGFITIQQLDTLIARINPEKSPILHNYLKKTVCRAQENKIEKIYGYLYS